MKNYTYRIIIEPDESKTFHGYVPALPGCHTWGDTMEETRQNIRDAIRAYLASLKDRELVRALGKLGFLSIASAAHPI